MKINLLIIISLLFINSPIFCKNPHINPVEFQANSEWAQYCFSIISTGDKKIASSIDKDGNIYVGGTKTISGQSGKIYLIKYNSLGAMLWEKSISGGDNDEIRAIETDQSGNVYVIGNSSDGLDQMDNAQIGGQDIFILVYDNLGNKKWSKYFGTIKDDFCWASAIDDVNIYIAGTKDDNTDPQAFFERINIASKSSDMSKLYGQPGSNDQGKSIAVDSQGNIYLVGSLNGDKKSFIAKYGFNGSFMKDIVIQGVSTISSTDIAMGSNYVVVSGYTDTRNNILKGKGTYQDSINGISAYLIKYNTDLDYIWGTFYDGNSGDYSTSLKIDNLNNIYLSGETFSNDLQTDLYNLGGNSDAYVVKFSPDGDRLWGTYFGGSNKESRTSVCTFDKYVYISGATESNNINSPKNSFLNPLPNTYLAKFDGSTPPINIKSISSGKTTFCQGENFQLNYVTEGNFYAGNEFIAEISNDDFKFDSLQIGLDKTKNGTILCTIPGNKSGSYKLRVKSTKPIKLSQNQLNITIDNSPKPVIKGNNSVCGGIEITYTSDNNLNNEWSVSQNSQFTISPDKKQLTIKWDKNPSSIKRDTIRLKQSNSNCSSTASLPVTINPTPTVELVGQENVVAGDIIDYHLKQPAFITKKWEVKKGTIVFESNAKDTIKVRWDNPGKDTVVLSGSISSCADNDTIFVNIFNKSEIIISGDKNSCVGLSKDYSVTNDANYTYSWSAFINGEIKSEKSTTNSIKVNWDKSGNGEVKLVRKHVQTNKEDSAIYPVKVNDNPVVTLNLPQTEFCQNDSEIILSGGNPGGGTYSGPGVNGNRFNPAQAGVGNHSIQYRFIDNNGCDGSDNQIVNVKAKPAKPVITRNGDELTSSSPTGNQWFKNGTEIPSATSQKFNATEAGDYQVQVTTNGCKSDLSDVVKVTANPGDFSITINGTSKLSETIVMCEGDPLKNIDINISGGSSDFTINTPTDDNNVKFTKNTGNVNIKVSSIDIVTNKNYEISIIDNISKIQKKISIILTVNLLPKAFQVDFGNEKIFESVPVLFKIINSEAGVIYNFESQGAIVEKLSETSANLTWSTIGTKTVKITAQKGECTRTNPDIEVDVLELQSSIEISLDKTEAEPGENITVTIKPGLPEGFRDTITLSYSKYELYNKSQTINNDDAVISVPIMGNISKDNQLLVLVGKQDEATIRGTSKLNVPITSKTVKITPVNIAGKEFRLRQNNSKININPNPAENRATIKISNIDAGNAELKIVNSLGITLETRTIEIKSRSDREELLDLSNYESGVYTIILLTKNGAEQENFVIIK